MLSAWACGAHGQSAIVVLPAAADAWRVTVFDGESHAEVTGDTLVVGQLGVTAPSRDGVRDAVMFDWKDRWEGVLRFESRLPLDLRAFVPRGTLEFDLDVAELAHGGIQG